MKQLHLILDLRDLLLAYLCGPTVIIVSLIVEDVPVHLVFGSLSVQLPSSELLVLLLLLFVYVARIVATGR